MTTISTIIATYNRADLLPQAIESVLSQSVNADLELVIVDDGSTDATDNVLQRYAHKPGVHIISQGNSGQATARERGFRESSGNLICFLDSDNRWKPGKLAQQLALMNEHPGVGVIYGENQFIDYKGNCIGRPTMKRYSGWITRHLLVDNCVNFNTAMVRREHMEQAGGFNPEIRIGDDYDLWLRMSPHCQFLYVPEVWTEYRIEGTRLSANKKACFESNRRVVEQFLANHPEMATIKLK